MKKILIAAMLTLNTGISLQGAATSSSSPNSDRIHIPLAILIDQKNEEPRYDSDAIAISFARSLANAQHIILVSSRLVWGLLKDWSEPTFATKYTVYEIPESSLFLFVPHTLQDLAEQVFQLNTLTKVNDKFILEEDLSDDSSCAASFFSSYKLPPELIDLLRNKTMQPAFGSTEEQVSIIKPLKQLFKQKLPQDIVFDIILAGHGNAVKRTVANLPVTEVQKFFSFLQKSVPVNVLWILTCQGGGKHLDELTYYAHNIEPVHKTFNFTVIISAVTDQTIPLPMRRANYFNDFFALAKKALGPAKGLNALLTHIAIIESGASKSGIERFPLVMLPGIQGIHTFNIDKNIFILNNVALTGHMLTNKGSTTTSILPESTPFIINNKLAVLIYPPFIKPPIVIEPNKLKNEWLDWEYSSNADAVENFMKEQIFAVAPLSRLAKKYNTIHSFSDRRFPQFISMIRGDATHLLDTIELLPLEPRLTSDNVARIPQPGVLSFIQDAFFTSFGIRFSRKTFLIGRLTGYNDLYIFYDILKTSNLGASFPELADIAAQQFVVEKQHDLTHAASFIARPITLEHVIVTSYSDITPPHFAQGMLSFEFGGKAWEHVPNDPAIFREKDILVHRAEFEEKAQEARL